MPRRKPMNVYPVKTLEEANDVMEKLAALKRLIDAEEMVMNDEIDAIKARTMAAVSERQKELESYENGLQAFSEQNKSRLFKTSRSIDLNFGQMGFRRATRLATLSKTTWKRVVELLGENGFRSAVRIKRSANKDVLSEWPDEKLERVGVRRKQTDTFWYEIKEERLPNGNDRADVQSPVRLSG
ncbi:MAG: host-nuclease inhibitor Gam family protein [Desulfobacterales bacterium]|nr:host-nuclease inhibitor Gam family protein [Desulfobacterales bacterium]